MLVFSPKAKKSAIDVHTLEIVFFYHEVMKKFYWVTSDIHAFNLQVNISENSFLGE